MDTTQVHQTLSDQQERFSRDSELVEREVDLSGHKNKVTVISGIRRAGKSTLLQLLNRKQHGCYVRFDDVRFAGFSSQNYEKIESFALRHSRHPVFFLDEVQDAPLWERWVNDLHTKGYKVYVTGSNAQLLRSEYATYLTGRHIPVHLMPFSFREILSYHGIDTPESLDDRSRALACFDTLLTNGSFPEVVISGDPALASYYYQDIVEKDIILRHGFRNRGEVFQFGLLMLSNIAKPLSYSRIRSSIGIKSLETVKSYLDAFVASFLLHTVRRFDHSAKKQVASPAKMYAGDPGFISQVGFHFSNESGRILENLVFLELIRRGHEVYYHRERHECDFLVKEGLAVTAAIQVCYTLDGHNRKREVNGLLEACATHSLERGLIITYDQEETIEKDGVQINIIPAWRWLLDRGS